MTEHEPELPRRDPHSLLTEADYWKALLDDFRTINDAVAAGAGAACDVPVALLELLLAPDREAATDKARAAIRLVLDAFERIGGRVEAMGELAEGRLVMLRREGGLDS